MTTPGNLMSFQTKINLKVSQKVTAFGFMRSRKSFADFLLQLVILIKDKAFFEELLFC